MTKSLYNVRMLNIFEKKNNTLAFVLIAIATIFWGGFGLVSAQAQITNIPPLLFITLGTLFSLLTAILMGLFSKNNNFSILRLVFNTNKNNDYSDIEKSDIREFRKTTLLRGFAGFGPVLTMAGFYLLDNKIIGVLISETYPIFSILISYFFFKKDFKKGNLAYDWVLIGLSFLGILILFPEEIYLSGDTEQLLAVIISLIGAILVAGGAVLSPKMTTQLSKIQKNGNLRNSLSGVFVTNLLIFCILFFTSIIFYSADDFVHLLDGRVLLIALIFGVFVAFLVNFLSRVGGAMATTHNIFLVWFLTPIIGTLLLWLFGFGEISATIVLAFILIFVPNILLNLDLEDSFSFKATFIWILLSAILLFYHQGKAIDSETYFNSASALLVFFALMVGYLISKLNERSNFREQLFMQFLHKARADGVDEKTIEAVSEKFQQANNRLTDEVKNELQKFSISTTKYSELLDFKFIQNRRLYNAGELFVLLMVSVLLIGITTLYRDNSFLYDGYAFIINTAVVFTLAQVVERMFFSDYGRHKSKQDNYRSITGIAFLTLLIIAIIILFFSKHNFVL